MYQDDKSSLYITNSIKNVSRALRMYQDDKSSLYITNSIKNVSR